MTAGMLADGAAHSIETFATWREAVCRNILNVSTQTEWQSGFAARIAGRSYGALRVASFRSSRHTIIRTRQHARQDAAPSYLVSFQMAGESHINQHGAQYTLRAGEMAVMDGSRPFEIHFPSDVERLVAIIPHGTLKSRAPWVDWEGAHARLPAHSPYLKLIVQHLLLLSPEHGHGGAEANLVIENICNLLALAAQQEVAGNDRASRFAGLLAYCRANLGSPELTPGAVARQFGLPLRTFHLRFRQTGTSFGHWLLEERLLASRAALRDPRQADRSISEIAYRLGFNDLSHFCRMFKRRFSVTASAWRRGPEALPAHE